MKRCLESVGAGPEVKRYYLHQPNKRVLDRFISNANLEPAPVGVAGD